MATSFQRNGKGGEARLFCVDPFGAVPILFILVPILMVGIVLYAVVKGVSEWSSNNAQPVLTVPVSLVAKRTKVWSDDSSSHTSYYVTFQLESGERREMKVGGSEYGQLAEGDVGQFSYQGTRYLGFVRTF